MGQQSTDPGGGGNTRHAAQRCVNVGREAREGGNRVCETIPQVASTLVQIEVATPSPDGSRHIVQRTAWGKANEGHRGDRESGELKGTAARAESL